MAVDERIRHLCADQADVHGRAVVDGADAQRVLVVEQVAHGAVGVLVAAGVAGRQRAEHALEYRVAELAVERPVEQRAVVVGDPPARRVVVAEVTQQGVQFDHLLGKEGGEARHQLGMVEHREDGGLRLEHRGDDRRRAAAAGAKLRHGFPGAGAAFPFCQEGVGKGPTRQVDDLGAVEDARKLVRVVGDGPQPRRAALVVGELAAEEILNALGAMLPGVLVEEDLANVLLRDGVCVTMKLVAVRFVFVIAHGGGHLEELEEPVVVGGEGGGAARLGRGERLALLVFRPEGVNIERSGEIEEGLFDDWHRECSESVLCFDLLLILHKREQVFWGEICAIWPLNGATRQIHLSEQVRIPQWFKDLAIQFRHQVGDACFTIIEMNIQPEIIENFHTCDV